MASIVYLRREIRANNPSRARRFKVDVKTKRALGDAIRRARESLQLTQERLAQRIGVDERAVLRWEHGDTVPRRRLIARLRVALCPAEGPTAYDALVPLLNALEAMYPAGKAPAVVGPAPATTVDPSAALERVVFGLADELDAAPRRAREALRRALALLVTDRISLEMAQRVLALGE